MVAVVADSSAARRVQSILDSLDSALDAGASRHATRPPSRLAPLFCSPPLPAHHPPCPRTGSSVAAAATPAALLPPPSVAALGTPSSHSAAAAATAAAAASSVSPFSMARGSPFGLAAGGSPFAALAGSAAAAASTATTTGPATAATRAPTLSLADLEEVARPATAFGASVTCRPHELADLHERLATFSNAQQWFCKPPAVSPLECARAGWELDGVDMLACRVCGARVKAPTALLLPPTTASAPAAAEALSGLLQQLRSGHGKLCPWASNASPPSLGALLLPSRHAGAPPSLQHGAALSRQQLRGRLAALLALPALPALAPAASEAMGACAALVGARDEAALLASLSRLLDLPPDCFDGADAPRWLAATQLALLGWGAAAGRTDALACVEDARTLGLWNFRALEPAPTLAAVPAALTFGAAAAAPGAAPAAAASDAPLAVLPGAGLPVRDLGGAAAGPAASDADADADARAAGLKPLLDPIAEHRTWSPWLAVTAGDTVPAWMRLVALLLPAPSPAAAAAKGTKRSASAALSSVIAMI